MRNTIIFAAILFVAVVITSVFYFGNLGRDPKSSIKPLHQLPADTYFISSFANDDATDNIFKDFQIFEAILGTEQTDRWVELKRQLLRSPKFAPLISGNQIFISFHPDDENIAPVFSVTATQDLDQRTLDQTLLTVSETYTVTTLDTNNIRLYELFDTQSDSINADQPAVNSRFYVTYTHGTFFASYRPHTLLRIADHREEKLSPKQVEYFEQHMNRNSAFSVFLPQQNTLPFIEAIKRARPGDFLRQFTDLHGQTVWNINFRQDALMLTGESQLQDNKNHYVSLFSRHQKTDQRLYRYFPENTMLYIEYSFSDRQRWFTDLRTWQDHDTPAHTLDGQGDQIDNDIPNLLRDFQSAIGNNFALVEQSNSDYLGFVSIQDTATFERLIDAVAQRSTDQIYRFRYSKTPYRFYGQAFKAFERPYFTRVDDVIVMANRQATVSNYLRDWKNKKILTGTIGFKNHEKIQGNDANVTFFVNRKLADPLIYNQLKSDYRKIYRDTDQYGFEDFYGWSLQLSGNDGNFISRLNATYKTKDRLGVSEAWSYPMKSRLINGPYVFDYADTSQFIVAQEQNHTVHAIRPNGEKLWSAVFSGRIVGEIQQLADRSLLLATDRRRLYRFDTEGHTLTGFSTSLRAEPTASPTLAQHDTLQFIVVPSAHSIMAFDMQGGPVTGWDEVQVEGRILGPIRQIDDQLVVSTSFGRVYFYDFQGNRTKEIDLPGDITFTGPLGAVKNDGVDLLYQADNEGRIYQIRSDGSSRIALQDTSWSKGYEITFQNIAGGTLPEMVVTEGTNLRVYGLGDTLTSVYDYAFTQPIRDRPVFSPASGGLQQLGVALRNNNLLYLLDDNGKLLDGFPIQGQPLFFYGKINYNSGNYLLTTKHDFKIYAYPH